MSSNREQFLVAAVDLGTTYSGYAFSFKREYDKDPNKVSTNRIWTCGKLISLKTPTCVLCDPNGKFHSFGYDAEDKYANLADDNAHHGWYFFRRFKTVLYERQIQTGIEVEDDKGLKMRAATVFAMAIRYLKEHLLHALHTMEEMATLVKVEDIHWILTVPAIWTDSAKYFMRDAAKMAGIDDRNLIIALESDAAVMYSQLLHSDHLSSKEGFDDKQFIVIDLGGETVDISVNEKQEDGSINEMYKASSRACGGSEVDTNFNQMIINIIGASVFKKFCEGSMYDHMDLCREFESKKRTVHTGTNDKITIRVPNTLKEAYEKESGETLKDAIEQSPYRGNIQLLRDKMSLDAELSRSLFQNCISKITEDLLDILEKPVHRNLSTLLMVGGFSECQLIQEAVKRAFPNLKVVKPVEAELAVLKGAVILGYNSGIACGYNFPWQPTRNKDRPPMTTMFAKQDDDDISTDVIAKISTFSSTYQQGSHHDQPGDVKVKSLSEEGEEHLSSDSEEIRMRRHDKCTPALETQQENQMSVKADNERAPSDDELFNLSRKLDKFNKDWWLLAKLLGLSDEKIEEIEQGGGNSVRQYYKMLTAWKRQNAGQEKGSVGYLLKQFCEAEVDQEVTVPLFRH